MTLYLNNFEYPSPKDAKFGFCEVVLEEYILKFRQCIFRFRELSPLGKGVAFHLNKLEFPSNKDAFTSLVEIGLVVMEKKIFLFRNHQCIFAISCSLPLEKGGALHLNKLESPSPKNA